MLRKKQREVESPSAIEKKYFSIGHCKKNQFLLYLKRKFNLFYSIVLGSEVLLSDSLLIFSRNETFFFYFLLFFDSTILSTVFDLQKDFCNVHFHTDVSFLFILQKNSYIARNHVFFLNIFLLQKDFDTFHMPLFEAFLCFSENIQFFLYIYEKNN